MIKKKGVRFPWPIKIILCLGYESYFAIIMLHFKQFQSLLYAYGWSGSAGLQTLDGVNISTRTSGPRLEEYNDLMGQVPFMLEGGNSRRLGETCHAF